MKWLTLFILLQCNDLLGNLGSWHSYGCHLHSHKYRFRTQNNLLATALWWQCQPSRIMRPAWLQKLIGNDPRDVTKYPRHWSDPNFPTSQPDKHLWNVQERARSMEAPLPSQQHLQGPLSMSQCQTPQDTTSSLVTLHQCVSASLVTQGECVQYLFLVVRS